MLTDLRARQAREAKARAIQNAEKERKGVSRLVDSIGKLKGDCSMEMERRRNNKTGGAAK